MKSGNRTHTVGIDDKDIVHNTIVQIDDKRTAFMVFFDSCRVVVSARYNIPTYKHECFVYVLQVLLYIFEG